MFKIEFCEQTYELLGVENLLDHVPVNDDRSGKISIGMSVVEMLHFMDNYASFTFHSHYLINLLLTYFKQIVLPNSMFTHFPDYHC